MEFKFISECLKKIGLQTPKLDILTPDARLYKTLLIQPCGNIETGGKFVKNINRDDRFRKR